MPNRTQSLIGGAVRLVSGVASETPAGVDANAGLAARTQTAHAPGLTIGGVGGGAPTDTTIGTPAWRMVGWGSPLWWFQDAATFATLHSRGWGGSTVGIQHMGVLGGDFYFKGTTSAGDSDVGPYLYQRMLEGLSAENAHYNPPLYSANNSMSSGIGFYLHSKTQNPDDAPCGGDWGNATNRTAIANYLADVAGLCNLVGLDEIHFDIEVANWSAGVASVGNRQPVFDFGKACGQAVYAVRPSLDTAVYSWYSTDGFDGEVQHYSNPAYPTYYAQGAVWEDFFCGWMEGMRLAGGTGLLYNLDAKFYRAPGNYMPSTYETAYKLDVERAIAWLSYICKPGTGGSRPWASEALWSYVAARYRAAGFTWHGTDGTGFYDSTQPSDADWSTDIAQARIRAMGPKRWEYNGPQGGSPSAESFYGNAGSISGGQAADDQTAISTSLPTITSLARVSNGGGSFTITCNAAHAYGVTHVELYLGASLLTTMGMTWNNGGGTTATNYNNSYQACSATITGRTAGDVITAVAFSAKDDRKAATVTL